jgi:putative hydroxymethylpyrimidine transport system ATP-binding protein
MRQGGTPFADQNITFIIFKSRKQRMRISWRASGGDIQRHQAGAVTGIAASWPLAGKLGWPAPAPKPAMRPASPGIVADGITLGFGTRILFSDLSFALPGGRFTVLLGTSGVGKSTLLRAIAGLTPLMRGSILTDGGESVAGQVAYMGQQDMLLPWLSTVENVVLGARLRGEAPDKHRAAQLLSRVGLDDRGDALPAELSGGMRQRAALARTLYEDRPILLMDEPFSALDAITRATVQDLASELLDGRTVLLITHDPLEACRLGHHLMLLSGRPATLSAPVHVPGAPPRAPDDPEVLRIQGQLLRMLLEQVP